MMAFLMETAEKSESIPADFYVGWIFGILSVGAVFLARWIARTAKDINDKIPKG